MEAMRRAVAGLSTLLIGLPAALPATLLAAFPVAGAWAQGTACPDTGLAPRATLFVRNGSWFAVELWRAGPGDHDVPKYVATIPARSVWSYHRFVEPGRNALTLRADYLGDQRVFTRVFYMNNEGARTCARTIRVEVDNASFGLAADARGTPPSPPPGTTRRRARGWSGRWLCKGPGDPVLTVEGEGGSARIRAYFARAHGGRPATDEYRIEQHSATTASGTYVYRDANPAKGPTGVVGLWIGKWTMTFDGDVMFLVRSDTSTSWRGSYTCRR